jgi:hypothetical protein
MILTGTFLDEITHDIPAQNWGPAEWAADFDHMKAVGIDTVILIRAGYRKHATFNSSVLQKEMGIFPVYTDLVDLYLTLAEERGMSFYFGTYDSGTYWVNGDYQRESDINRAFCDEVMAKYGHRKAFKGWYISHEIHSFNDGMMQVYEQLATHLRALKSIPILISPYVKGSKQFGAQAITLKDHEKEWDQVFARIQNHVDICAFQDGQVHYHELEEYLHLNKTLAHKYGLTAWSNVESFDRDMPWNFPPIPFKNLRYKMEAAARSGVDKLITFEFSHFMSPQSMYPSAAQLYARYQEYLRNNVEV